VATLITRIDSLYSSVNEIKVSMEDLAVYLYARTG